MCIVGIGKKCDQGENKKSGDGVTQKLGTPIPFFIGNTIFVAV